MIPCRDCIRGTGSVDIPIQRPLNTGRRLVSCRAALIEEVCLTTSQKEMIVLAELVDEHGQPVEDYLTDWQDDSEPESVTLDVR